VSRCIDRAPDEQASIVVCVRVRHVLVVVGSDTRGARRERHEEDGVASQRRASLDLQHSLRARERHWLTIAASVYRSLRAHSFGCELESNTRMSE